MLEFPSLNQLKEANFPKAYGFLLLSYGMLTESKISLAPKALSEKVVHCFNDQDQCS